MKVECAHISFERRGVFVPLKVFKVELEQNKWIEVNRGKYPPVELKGLITETDYPGIDGQHIEIEIDPHSVCIKPFDSLNIDGYELFITKVY